mmetsp:Transcript_30857/g.89807  ORF Transcript_30857/g.89807 Transcript_30857/m.89807 type:complete len:225 (-) Transcript_30857:131-805(-)
MPEVVGVVCLRVVYHVLVVGSHGPLDAPLHGLRVVQPRNPGQGGGEIIQVLEAADAHGVVEPESKGVLRLDAHGFHLRDRPQGPQVVESRDRREIVSNLGQFVLIDSRLLLHAVADALLQLLARWQRRAGHARMGHDEVHIELRPTVEHVAVNPPHLLAVVIKPCPLGGGRRETPQIAQGVAVELARHLARYDSFALLQPFKGHLDVVLQRLREDDGAIGVPGA